jgi:hypothetical protein
MKSTAIILSTGRALPAAIPAREASAECFIESVIQLRKKRATLQTRRVIISGHSEPTAY